MDMLPRPERPSVTAMMLSCVIASLGFALTGFSMLWMLGYPIALMGLFGIYLALAPDTLISHGVSAAGALAMGKALASMVTLLDVLFRSGRVALVAPLVGVAFWFLLAPTVVARAITFRSKAQDESMKTLYYSALGSGALVAVMYLLLRAIGLPVPK